MDITGSGIKWHVSGQDRPRSGPQTPTSGPKRPSAPFVGPEGERRAAQVRLNAKSNRKKRINSGKKSDKHDARKLRISAWEFCGIINKEEETENGDRFRHRPAQSHFRFTHSAPDLADHFRRPRSSRGAFVHPVPARPRTSPGTTCSWKEAMDYVTRLRQQDKRLQEEVKHSFKGNPDRITPETGEGNQKVIKVISPDIPADLITDLSESFNSVMSGVGQRSGVNTPGSPQGQDGDGAGRGGRKRMSLAAIRRMTTAGEALRNQAITRDRERERMLKKQLTVRTPRENIQWRFQLRRKLHHVFRLARFVVSMCFRMKEHSMSRTQESRTAQLYMYNANGAVEEEERVQNLFFDKAEYSRQRRSRCPLPVRTVAQKPVHLRSGEEHTALYGALSNIRSFKDKYTEQMKGEMCKVAWYLSCETGRVVLRQGHQGFNFYFIYSGSVFVQVSGVDPHTREPYTSIVAVIPAGGAFGELALLGGKGQRTASIICREPTELFQIDKDAFLDICKDVYSAELEYKISIAKRHPLFGGWTPEKIKELCFASQMVTVPSGRLVERDWAAAKHIYFVLEGKVQLLQEIQETRIQEMTRDHMFCKGLASEATWSKYRDLIGGKDGKRSRFYIVGELKKDDCSDLRILDPKRIHKVSHVILVSHGVKLLRMDKTQVEGMAPKGSIHDILEENYKSVDIPEMSTLEARCTSLVNWDTYKQHEVAGTLERRKAVANIYPMFTH